MQKISKKLLKMPKDIRKRDGRIVLFDLSRIAVAIFKAFEASGNPNHKIANELAEVVLQKLLKKHREPAKFVPAIEEIQDIVEETLIEKGFARIAKAYILYREKRAEIRTEKQQILDKEEIDEIDKKFDSNALRVLKSRYLRKDINGRAIESPKELFTRVAIHASLPDIIYDKRVYSKKISEIKKVEEDDLFCEKKWTELEGKLKIGKHILNRFHTQGLCRMFLRIQRDGHAKIGWEKLVQMLKKDQFKEIEKRIDDFFSIMTERKFMPNTPAIANFGNHLGMGSACFALGIDDSIHSIMDTLKSASIIFKAGGGLGYNFSKLRPEGDYIKTTGGTSSGPLIFMRLFDTMTEVIKQGGIRRGANMGIMNSNHPDIEKFVVSKDGNKALRNFNISVMLMPDFWDYYRKDKPYPLINPRTNEISGHISPRLLLDKIAYQAWESGEPGIIFNDKINEFNPFFKSLGPIMTTNPCVTKDTFVSTARGLERIDSLISGRIVVDKRADVVLSGELVKSAVANKNGQNQEINRWQKEKFLLSRGVSEGNVDAVFQTGFKEVFNLETKSGYEIKATGDHRFLTPFGWKELNDLKRGDKIYIQSGNGLWNNNDNLPFETQNMLFGKNGRVYNFNFPQKWSRDLGRVTGWLTGDGWLSEKNHAMGWVFADEDSEARLKLQPVIEKYLNREVKHIETTSGVRQIRSASATAVNFFRNIGVKDSGYEREAPRAIFTANKEAVAGFIEGLFSSDGTVALNKNKSRNYVRLNSSSLKLLKDIQILLLNFGIKGSIFDRSAEPKIFEYNDKNGKIKIYRTSGKNYELNISKENLLKFSQTFEFFQKGKNDKLKKIAQDFEFYREYFIEEVKNIESRGVQEVWDLTESKTHSFIGNGFVVHNCGEVLLYPNESCNLGSINIWSFVKKNSHDKKIIDWENLEKVIRIATRFLDNIIDVNIFPLKEIEEMSLNTRKIGLGIMGAGSLMYDLEIPFNSSNARALMEKIMEFVNYYSKLESVAIARERGPFPFYKKSFFPEGKMPFKGFYDKKSWNCDWNVVVKEVKKHGIRNSYTTVIAPTGSISMIAGCSSGIEPVFSLAFEKNVSVGSFYYIDPIFEKVMLREGLFDEILIRDVIANSGSVSHIAYIPPKFKKIFVSAHDITPEDHIKTLSSFQKWVDSSISKTNNFPADATVDDVKKSYLLAYETNCKAVTVFRDKSIKDQVLITRDKKKEKKEELIRMTDVKAEGMAVYKDVSVTSAVFNGNAGLNGAGKPTHCPNCKIPLSHKEGCISCSVCGWGLCA